ncbi:MAG: hypothetical protein CMN22_07055 [Rubrivirga sp.]|nr:hypothetical protein [Rubrivirga sp.]
MVACSVDFVGNAEPLSSPRSGPYRRLHDYLLATMRHRPVLVECCHNVSGDGGNSRRKQVQHVRLIAVPTDDTRGIEDGNRTGLDPSEEGLTVIDVVPCGSNDDYVEPLTHRCRLARRPDHPLGVETAIIQRRGQERLILIPVRKGRARG